jgi:hypothetical protein
MTNAITLLVPAKVAMPRGADWAAAFFAATARAVHTLWSSAAVACAQNARAQQAAQLRRFAATVGRSDPSFAADLYAAADRHIERG